jgi:hypothetical protein
LVVGGDDLMLLEKTPVRMDLSHSWYVLTLVDPF